MIRAVINESLAGVEAGWMKNVKEFDPLAQKLLEPPTFRLSKLLINAFIPGGRDIGEKELSACRAVELLDQALRLGDSAGADPQEYDEDHLLITDYLYAQAIDQVITINEPRVISLLAGAIMSTAQDRIESAIDPRHPRLMDAAVAIGAHLSGGKV